MGRRENEHTRTDIGNGDLSGRAGRGPGAKTLRRIRLWRARRRSSNANRSISRVRQMKCLPTNTTIIPRRTVDVRENRFAHRSVRFQPMRDSFRYAGAAELESHRRRPEGETVPAVKASFDFCSQALANLQDSKLGDTVNFFGGRKVPRARALIELTDDLEDHYSQLASYLRLNGMVPPSVKPAK